MADEIVGYRDCDGILVSPIQGQDYGVKVAAKTKMPIQYSIPH
jgi:hypothetical protein